MLTAAVLASKGLSTDERLMRLGELDLTNIGRKLMEPAPEGKGWTAEQVTNAELWYRRYLELCLRYPSFPVVPNYPIDTFWHQHILDTRAYIADCNNVFGEYLHHYPYFGLNGDADVRDDSFDQTNVMYREHFGADCKSMDGFTKPKVASCDHGTGGGGVCASAQTSTECVEVNQGVACQGCEPSRSLLAPAELVGTGASQGMNCNSGGSGTGCGQGCGGGSKRVMDQFVTVGMNCGHGGSGTGCGQGCGRGK